MVAAHGASHNAHSYADAIPELVSTFEASLVGVIKADQITANTDNYAPLGYQTNNVYRIDLDADRNFTGMAGGTENAVRCLINISTHTLTLKHDVTSTAANRLFLDFSTDQPLDPNGAAIFRYDTLSSRWRLISLVVDYTALQLATAAVDARVTALDASIEERAQDAVGAMIGDTTYIDLTYTDSPAGLIAALLPAVRDLPYHIFWDSTISVAPSTPGFPDENASLFFRVFFETPPTWDGATDITVKTLWLASATGAASLQTLSGYGTEVDENTFVTIAGFAATPLTWSSANTIKVLTATIAAANVAAGRHYQVIIARAVGDANAGTISSVGVSVRTKVY